MLYSLTNSKKQKFSLGNEIQNSYIHWHIDKPIYALLEIYKNSYTPKNDIIIFDISYFNILFDLLSSKSFSLQNFDLAAVLENFQTKIFNKRHDYYHSQCTPKIISEFNDLDDEIDDEFIFSDSDKILECLESQKNLVIPEKDEVFTQNKEYETDIAKFHALALKDSEIIYSYTHQILEQNPLILKEFKEFLIGFYEYMIQLMPEEYYQFKTYFHILNKDMEFFKNTKVLSLSKYKFFIGASSKKSSGDRGKTDDFIPAGTCYYGDKIFMNSSRIKKKYGNIWFKRGIRRVFYHEVGHALDYLYFNEIVLKGNVQREKSSHNEEFKNICRKNYKKFRILKSYLSKKHTNWLAYYVTPVIQEKTLRVEKSSEIIDDFSKQLNKDYHIFSDIMPSQQIVHQAPTQKKFSSKINATNYTFDFSKPLVESWAESFAFVFSWIKNGFSEYDKFAITAGKSQDRNLIKLQHDCMLYILENFDWSKLNISYAVYLKRKTHIKKYLKHIKNMPLFSNKANHRKFKSKVYLTYHDLLKYT